MKKIILIWAGISLISLSELANASTSKDLLAKALSAANSINNSLTVEQKLSKYEEVQNTVDTIFSEHSGTDEGIKLLSGESIGNFDYAKIQNNYIAELTNYYDTVCKVAPSFKCIAFVSLDQGNKSCKTASDFETLDSAHREIINALNIFSSQDAKDEYKSLALNSYRSCLNSSKIQSNQQIHDYFSSKLVPMFLMLGNPDSAKAVIQQLNDPYLKFSSVFELTKSSDKGVTREYLDRMAKFAKEKLSWQAAPCHNCETVRDYRRAQNLAAFKLKTELLRQENFPLNISRKPKNDFQEDFEGLLYPLGKQVGGAGGIDKIRVCSAMYNKAYFHAAIDLVDATATAADKLGTDGRDWRGPSFNLKNVRGFLNACGARSDGRALGTAFAVYTYIRAVLDDSEANSFLSSAAAANYDEYLMREYLFQLETKQPAVKAAVEGWGFAVYDLYFAFKRTVRNGDMCKAVDMLFKDFKDTTNYNRAIAYLIESPDVDRAKKYDCGDAELEMLLN